MGKIDGAVRANLGLSFALYVVRDDGDGDLVAVFPGDAGREHYCEVNEENESFAYHLAHETGASLESDAGDLTEIRWAELPDEFPRVLEFECSVCGSEDAHELFVAPRADATHLCAPCFAAVEAGRISTSRIRSQPWQGRLPSEN